MTQRGVHTELSGHMPQGNPSHVDVSPNAADYPVDHPTHRGLVCRVVGENGEEIDCRNPTPIEEGGVVMPDGWLTDENGRGLSILEMAALRRTQAAA